MIDRERLQYYYDDFRTRPERVRAATYIGAALAAAVLVLVAVVMVALSSGPVTGLLAGTCAGLAQDALSSGIIGIGGLAKTVVGYLAGVLGSHLIVARPLTRFLVFVAATFIHAVIFMGLYVLLELRRFGSPYAPVLSQAAANGLVGVLVFQLVELLPGVIERRRLGRGARVTRRLR